MIEQKWKYKNIDPELIAKVAQEFKLPEIYARVMAVRGVTDRKKSRKYFFIDPVQLHDPFLMKDMEKAVNLVNKYLNDKKRILVFGDYDVDGTTGTAMFYLFLKSIGGDVQFYIPNRETEGYGLSFQSIDYAAAIGAELLITCDCGINAMDKVKYASDKNIETIITDHHLPDITLPEAGAIVNPNQKNCGYPFKGLCGAGVIFKLALAICQKNGLDSDLAWKYSDLITLGTAADIVPIIDENRVIVNLGIKRIEQGENIGIKALLHSSGLTGKEITVGRLVFWLAPKINAAGRLGDAGRAVKLLTTTNPVFAHQMAKELERENQNRQKITSDIVEEAIFRVNSTCNLDKDNAIILADKSWHAGVIGIVASRIREMFYRPTFIIAIDNQGVGKGSGRSIRALNLYETLSECRETLIGYGGHAIAAGLSVKMENIESFKSQFLEIAKSKISKSDLTPILNIDGILPISTIDGRFMKFLKALSPYGPGNMRPKFVSEGVKVKGMPKLLGKASNVLKFQVIEKQSIFEAVGFDMAEHYEKLLLNKPIDIAFEVGENEWNGQKYIQLELKDIKISK